MPPNNAYNLPMRKYILASLLQSILVLLGVLVLVFFLVRITGDPARLMLSREASPEQIAEFRHNMGFDRPMPVQFVDFVGGILQGDFGSSLHYRLPALPLILERLPATFELATVALFFAVVASVPLGLIGGFRPGSRWDSLARAVGLFGQSTPGFWLGLLMIVAFAVNLGWLPPFGRSGPSSYIMPAIVIGLGTMGQLVRLTRSSVLEIRQEDYIRTANSKGLSNRVIYIKHVLRNAAIPVVSVLGIDYADMIGGSLITESIFAWPGLGRLAADAIAVRDFPLVQAVAFFTSILVIALNFLTDVGYALIDPRIRYGE
jgi:ABC-type dipeptide/oligopeptide/nickel transport system permease component